VIEQAMPLTIELNEEQPRLLQEVADRLQMTSAELARAASNDLLYRQDEDFECVMQRVLK
jgi:predicted transcriptional regulator